MVKNSFRHRKEHRTGGVISPLLANIALHGLETAITDAFNKNTPNYKERHNLQPRVIRYADDFVVLHRDLKVIRMAKETAQVWLMGMGLELKPSKTTISHTFTAHEGKVGFDFLGFNVRQFAVGKSNYRTAGRIGIRLDFKAIIKPRSAAVVRHYRAIAKVIDRLKSVKQADLIKALNPIIRGWSAYYSTVVSKKIFSKLDHLVTKRLLRWARSPSKSRVAAKNGK